MSIGKSINTDTTDWPQKEEQVMQTALVAMFSNPRMNLALQKTEKIIAEATTNYRWGIGLSMNHKDAFSKGAWTGKNMLGQMLQNLKLGSSEK